MPTHRYFSYKIDMPNNVIIKMYLFGTIDYRFRLIFQVLTRFAKFHAIFLEPIRTCILKCLYWFRIWFRINRFWIMIRHWKQKRKTHSKCQNIHCPMSMPMERVVISQSIATNECDYFIIFFLYLMIIIIFLRFFVDFFRNFCFNLLSVNFENQYIYKN